MILLKYEFFEHREIRLLRIAILYYIGETLWVHSITVSDRVFGPCSFLYRRHKIFYSLEYLKKKKNVIIVDFVSDYRIIYDYLG